MWVGVRVGGVLLVLDPGRGVLKEKRLGTTALGHAVTVKIVVKIVRVAIIGC